MDDSKNQYKLVRVQHDGAIGIPKIDPAQIMGLRIGTICNDEEICNEIKAELDREHLRFHIRSHILASYDIERDVEIYAYANDGIAVRYTANSWDRLRFKNDMAFYDFIADHLLNRYEAKLKLRRDNIMINNNYFDELANKVSAMGGRIEVDYEHRMGRIVACPMVSIVLPADKINAVNIGLTTRRSASIPAIADIQVFNDRVVMVKFVDGTFTKCVADVDEDGNTNFDLYTGIAFCLFKRKLGLDGNKEFNKLMRSAMKFLEDKAKAAEEAEKAREEARQKKLKKNAKAVLKAHKNREEDIEFFLEVLRRDREAVKEETNE